MKLCEWIEVVIGAGPQLQSRRTAVGLLSDLGVGAEAVIFASETWGDEEAPHLGVDLWAATPYGLVVARSTWTSSHGTGSRAS
jgi:hypothetical protein